jgi:hypothetical protein
MRLRSGLLICAIAVALYAFASSIHAIERNNVLGIWLFDENQGAIAKDSSGNGRDGEILGGVERVAGTFGEALSFPGTPDSMVIIPHDDDLNVAAFSITAWIKYKVTGRQFQVIVTKGSEATTYGYYLIVYASPPQFNIAGFTPSPQDWKEAFGTTDVRDDQWHHLAGTYDKNSVRFYLDGEMEGELAVSSDPDVVDTPLAIGAQHDGTWPAEGVIDEVGLFNVGLTQDEVESIMTNGIAEATGVISVSASAKLAIVWGKIKAQ